MSRNVTWEHCFVHALMWAATNQSHSKYRFGLICVLVRSVTERLYFSHHNSPVFLLSSSYPLYPLLHLICFLPAQSGRPWIDFNAARKGGKEQTHGTQERKSIKKWGNGGRIQSHKMKKNIYIRRKQSRSVKRMDGKRGQLRE